MTLIVEDGTGVEGANAYVTVDECATYCAARGLTFSPSPDIGNEAAIIRATTALDALYRGRFSGYRTHGRSQPLEWPRSNAYDREWNVIAGDEIPIEVKNATCEMAVRELATPGSMMPDLDRGGLIQSLKAGSVEIVYGSNAPAQATYQIIDGILGGLLGQAQVSFVGTAVRG